MSWFSREPKLSEILSDSIVKALMNADGVNPIALEVMLRQIAAGDHAPIASDPLRLQHPAHEGPTSGNTLARAHPVLTINLSTTASRDNLRRDFLSITKCYISDLKGRIRLVSVEQRKQIWR